MNQHKTIVFSAVHKKKKCLKVYQSKPKIKEQFCHLKTVHKKIKAHQKDYIRSFSKSALLSASNMALRLSESFREYRIPYECKEEQLQLK